MFREILKTQWKWSWILVAIAIACAIIIPVIGIGHIKGGDLNAVAVREVVTSVERTGWFYGLLAASLGTSLGSTAWGADTAGSFVYAMSLPLPRWHYVMNRFLAGALLILPVALVVGISGYAVVAAATLPAGLHPYVGALALRFLLAALLSYAFVFGAAAPAPKTVLAAAFAFILLLVFSGGLSAAGFRGSIIDRGFEGLFSPSGPFAVFIGRWMLIDV